MLATLPALGPTVFVVVRVAVHTERDALVTALGAEALVQIVPLAVSVPISLRLEFIARLLADRESTTNVTPRVRWGVGVYEYAR